MNKVRRGTRVVEADKENKFHMVYSVGVPKGTPRHQYRRDQYDITTMKQKVVAFEGPCIVVAGADPFWCAQGLTSRPYRSRVISNPTWGDLFRCSKSQQKKTGDLHHCFFEGAHIEERVNGVAHLRLSLGS